MTLRLIESAGLTAIYDKVMNGERLTAADGLALYENPNLNAVGALANIVRERQPITKPPAVAKREIGQFAPPSIEGEWRQAGILLRSAGHPDPATGRRQQTLASKVGLS